LGEACSACVTSASNCGSLKLCHQSSSKPLSLRVGVTRAATGFFRAGSGTARRPKDSGTKVRAADEMPEKSAQALNAKTSERPKRRTGQGCAWQVDARSGRAVMGGLAWRGVMFGDLRFRCACFGQGPGFALEGLRIAQHFLEQGFEGGKFFGADPGQMLVEHRAEHAGQGLGSTLAGFR